MPTNHTNHYTYIQVHTLQCKFVSFDVFNFTHILRVTPPPAGTWRNNNVIIASKRRRFDVMMTLLSHHVSAGLTLEQSHDCIIQINRNWQCTCKVTTRNEARETMCIVYNPTDAVITSLLRQNDGAASFWRNNGGIITLCVRCEDTLICWKALAKW